MILQRIFVGSTTTTELRTLRISPRVAKHRRVYLAAVKDRQSLSKQEKLPIAINAYNALAIHAILVHYPVASIQLLNRKRSEEKVFD